MTVRCPASDKCTQFLHLRLREHHKRWEETFKIQKTRKAAMKLSLLDLVGKPHPWNVSNIPPEEDPNVSCPLNVDGRKSTEPTSRRKATSNCICIFISLYVYVTIIDKRKEAMNLGGRRNGEWNGGFRIRYGEGQQKWLDNHENKSKTATGGVEEVGGRICRRQQRPGIKEAPKNQWGCLICDSHHCGYGSWRDHLL